MLYPNKILLVSVIVICIYGLSYINNHKLNTDADFQFNIWNFDSDPLIVRKCNEFVITGNGSNVEWEKSSWNLLTKLDKGGKEYLSKFKILYSNSGIYILFKGEDEKITTKEYNDMNAIWQGDVFEVFFHPNPDVKKYFEYQVNPFEKQIVLTITNSQEDGFLSWVPSGRDRKNYKIENKVEILGGRRELDAKIESWSAEIFLSYKSMALLSNVPPKSGMVWKANFCRLDYDDIHNRIKWSWSPTIKNSFHELESFRSIKFE